jgi:ABC-type nitrate/sulfonate/bicarbonate transport system substrate-binding protein
MTRISTVEELRMKWTRRAVLRTAALAPLAACAPAAAPASPAASPVAPPSPATAPAAARPLDVVRQGDLTSIVPGAAIARARGYFRELGIDSQQEVFASGAEQTPLLASGQLDVGTSSSQAGLYNAVGRGVQQRWVVDNGHLERSVPSVLLVLRQDVLPPDGTLPLSAIQGRTLAAPTPMKQGGLGFAAARMLATIGLTVDDVDWQILPFASMTELLTNRAVDGALVIEPFFTLASQRVPLVAWQNLADYYPGQQAGGLVYSEQLVAERPDVARRWLVGLLRGIRDLNDWMRQGQPADATAAILAEYTRLPPDVVTRVRWLPVNPDGYLNLESIDADQRQLLAWGAIPQLVPLDVLVDHQFCDYAVAQLGPYRG